jgi:hypothetical protein
MLLCTWRSLRFDGPFAVKISVMSSPGQNISRACQSDSGAAATVRTTGTRVEPLSTRSISSCIDNQLIATLTGVLRESVVAKVRALKRVEARQQCWLAGHEPTRTERVVRRIELHEFLPSQRLRNRLQHSEHRQIRTNVPTAPSQLPFYSRHKRRLGTEVILLCDASSNV